MEMKQLDGICQGSLKLENPYESTSPYTNTLTKLFRSAQNRINFSPYIKTGMTINNYAGNAATENTLACRLFEASYDNEIVGGRKDSLLSTLYKNINGITSNVDSSASKEEVLNSLEREIFGSVRYGENSLYSGDFASKNPSANCVGYASILVSCLEQIDRKDILACASVKNDDKHVWMEFDLGKSKYYFNRQNHSSEISHDLSYLELLNANSLGNELLRSSNYKKALNIFRRIGSDVNNFAIGQRNLNIICGNLLTSGGWQSQLDKLLLINPQCDAESVAFMNRAKTSATFQTQAMQSSSYLNLEEPQYNNHSFGNQNNLVTEISHQTDPDLFRKRNTSMYRSGFDEGEDAGYAYGSSLAVDGKKPTKQGLGLPFDDYSLGYTHGFNNGIDDGVKAGRAIDDAFNRALKGTNLKLIKGGFLVDFSDDNNTDYSHFHD